ncbi:MAG TPA: hypothetical protein VD694_04325 [Nitrososphaeraceae archaeon]|nr:hypothetical protein [Nitrososphaeraceae archaeon]
MGLIRYYSKSSIDTDYIQDRDSTQVGNQHNDIQTRVEGQKNRSQSIIFFVTIFIVFLVISAFTYNENLQIFTSWDNIEPIELGQLFSGVMLCFFMPGYAVVLIITKNHKLNPVLSVLLACLCSMLITGAISYISALYFDIPISENKTLFIAIYIIILVSLCVYYRTSRIWLPVNQQIDYYSCYHFLLPLGIRLKKFLKTNASELLVFVSLLTLIIGATYYLYGGITIGDQWFHQGRALLFMEGSIKEATLSNAEISYPPFQSALLAALTTLSGIPLVNAYASIAFLNMTPLFAFYYFFTTWVSPAMRRSGLLACSLFTVSSGFGWIYLLSTLGTEPIISEQSSLNILGNMRSLDIIGTSNFVIPTAPDFSTGLIYIALPAGFLLLGIVRARINMTFTNLLLVAIVSVLGIISHDEFYIFVIISAIVPILFNLPGRNYQYLGLLVSFSIVYLMDILAPAKFFTSNTIMEIPLFYLILFFVVISWTVYTFRIRLLSFSKAISNSFKLRSFLGNDLRIHFIIGMFITFMVVYIYLLSFIVIGHLSLADIKDQTFDSNLPWYLYPMRMGIVGLFGVAFVLYAFFRKSEKYAYVFGILVVVAFFTGPYYDEHRFSKYVMVGMIGLATIAIFKILNQKHGPSNRNSIIIGSVIVIACLSNLLFIGYGSLILQTNNYYETLPRRNFPSVSELNLFNFFESNSDVDSKKYNVVSFPDEYNRWQDGLISKIQAFSGLPYNKIHQMPLVLNASTIDEFYRLLDATDSRYIVLSKDNISTRDILPEPVSFALQYFEHVYEDQNYVVLDIPDIKGPSSSSAEVALLYDREDHRMSPSMPVTKELKYDKSAFSVNNGSGNASTNTHYKTTILKGSNLDKGVSLWSKKIQSENPVNYIEAKFRIISENKDRNNDVKLKWSQGDTEYYVSLSKAGIELYRQSENQSDKTSLFKNMEIEKKDHFWYTIRIENLPNTINIYVNSLPKIHVSGDIIGNNTESISKVGFTSYFNDIEIAPINIGSITENVQKNDNQIKYYNFDFPISLFALSEIGYDTFSKNDLSALSKNIVVTSDTEFDEFIFDKYLSYIRTGGKVLVINPHDNYNGTFSKLFSIQSNGSILEKFTNIAYNRNKSIFLDVQGLVNSSQAVLSPDINIIASYKNSKNQTIAPFAIEKNFPNGGKIILINAKPYFNSISEYPKRYYLTLSNISKLLNLELDKIERQQDLSGYPNSFVGRMNLSGSVILNSSSLSLLSSNELKNHPVINTSRITLYDYEIGSNTTLKDARIKDLKLGGNYSASIQANGSIELPGSESNYGYLNFLTQNKDSVNMRVHLPSNRFSFMEISFQNGTLSDTIRISNGSVVDLYEVESASPLEPISILLKNPKIMVKGNTSIENSNFDGYLNVRGKLNADNPFNMEGQLKAKFDFIDHYHLPDSNNTRINYISYLQDIVTDGKIDKYQTLVKLPGDIPYKGDEIPWKNIFTSASNVILLMLLTAVSVIISWRFWPKIKYDGNKV